MTVRLLLENEPISDQPGVDPPRRPAICTSSRRRATWPWPTCPRPCRRRSSTAQQWPTRPRSGARSSKVRRWRWLPSRGATSSSTPAASRAMGSALRCMDRRARARRRWQSPARGVASTCSPRTACSSASGPEGLEFWGLPWVQRLVPDAVGHFPELAGLSSSIAAQPGAQGRGRSRPGLPGPGASECPPGGSGRARQGRIVDRGNRAA